MSIVQRSFRHWTPLYIVNRLSTVWYEYRNPGAPWLTADMVNILDTWLKPTDVGLEWGSGRSTVWFARRVAKLTSVEHDKEWAARVVATLNAERLENRVEYYIVDDVDTVQAEARYVGICDAIPEGSLDFCLIDGLARDRCALGCLDRLKGGGIIIIDNINWYLPRERKSKAPNSRGMDDGAASEQWILFGEAVKDWRCIWTSNGVSDTALWQKPAGL